MFSCWVISDFYDPMGFSPLGSSVHGILQVGMLEWVAFPSLGDLPPQGSNSHLLHWQADSLSLSHQGSPRPIFCCLVTNSCPILCNPMDCVDCQAPLSMGFSRQNTGVGCHFLLQGIFLIQGSNPVSCVSCIGME